MRIHPITLSKLKIAPLMKTNMDFEIIFYIKLVKLLRNRCLYF